MTTHVHNPTYEPASADPDAEEAPLRSSTRPRWVAPALAIGAVVVALVVAGVVPLSTALYGGLFGGMMLMHLGGHGGHGDHGGGHEAAHAAHAASDGEGTDDQPAGDAGARPSHGCH